jgi:hypothetical protein
MDEIIDIVARRSPRWEAVRFDFCWIFQKGLCFISASFPLLQTLDFRVLGIRDDDRITIFQNAPQLRAVHLTGSSFDAIIIPSIQPLQLSIDYETYSASYRSGIWTKLGRTFSSSIYALNTFPYRFLTLLITRSSCSLVQLSLSYRNEDNLALIDLLSVTPSVLELNLLDGNLDGALLRSLGPNRTGNSSPFSSNSKAFSFTGAHQFQLSVLASMLRLGWGANGKAERNGTVNLQSVHIDTTASDVNAEIDDNSSVADIRQLIADGMEISIRNSGAPNLL